MNPGITHDSIPGYAQRLIDHDSHGSVSRNDERSMGDSCAVRDVDGARLQGLRHRSANLAAIRIIISERNVGDLIGRVLHHKSADPEAGLILPQKDDRVVTGCRDSLVIRKQGRARFDLIHDGGDREAAVSASVDSRSDYCAISAWHADDLRDAGGNAGVGVSPARGTALVVSSSRQVVRAGAGVLQRNAC